MCGLFGAYSANRLWSPDTETVKLLGYLSLVRGSHSTGITVAGRRKKNKTAIQTIKRTLPSDVFLREPEVLQTMEARSNPFLIMGHCRLATSGSVNERNAHPIQEKHLIGCHNGTIFALEPSPEHKDYLTDSRVLYRKIAEEGLQRALDSVGQAGAYALTYIDNEAKTFNIVRNDKRPLWLMLNIMKDVVFWASEKDILEFAKAHVSVNFHEPVSVDPYVHLTWRLGDKANEPQKTTITKPPHRVIPVGFLPAREVAGEVWCYGCQKLLRKCECAHSESDYGDDGSFIGRVLSQAEALLTFRKYRGPNGIVSGIQHVLPLLQAGCGMCGSPQDEEDTVWWCGDDTFICNECKTNDMIVQAYTSIDNFYKGGLVFQ